MQPYNESVNSTAIAEEQLQKEVQQLRTYYPPFPVPSCSPPWYIQYLPEILLTSFAILGVSLFFMYRRYRIKRVFRNLK
ncbi:hypothetical protein DDW13_05585 [Acidianus hospitalis]|uniref:Uncharacterized protein n=1 Tax=Acidianus hospitalis TaxID=563177 RepID=A0A2T9X4K7_9CREN|nr:hypothetical protein DDW13_05585 [Acidianus hospitalis]